MSPEQPSSRPSEQPGERPSDQPRRPTADQPLNAAPRPRLTPVLAVVGLFAAIALVFVVITVLRYTT